MALKALRLASIGMAVLSLSAFCFSAVMIFGGAWGLLLGFSQNKALLITTAAIALAALSIIGPLKSGKDNRAEWQRWLWVLSPALPFVALVFAITK
jgi:hypothetical protein